MFFNERQIWQPGNNMNFQQRGFTKSQASNNKALLDDGGEQRFILVMVAAAICYVLCLLFHSVLRIKMKKSVQRMISLRLQRVIISFFWTSTELVFATVFSITQTVVTPKPWPSQSLSIEAGKAIQAPQQLAASSSLLFTIGVWYMFKSEGGGSVVAKSLFDSSGALDAFYGSKIACEEGIRPWQCFCQAPFADNGLCLCSEDL